MPPTRTDDHPALDSADGPKPLAPPAVPNTPAGAGVSKVPDDGTAPKPPDGVGEPKPSEPTGPARPPEGGVTGPDSAPGAAVAGACNRASFGVAIDVGHTAKNYGAMSARDVPEFTFNQRLANELLAKLQATGFAKADVVVQSDSDLIRRARDLSGRKPNLMLSLHHDSVQDQFLVKGELEGKQRTFTRKPDARGYSIFISRDNSRLEESKRFAKFLGNELLKRGLKPTMHHHEPLPGENRPIFDERAGVFFYDHLVVLRQVTAPAVLLESAVITEPDDENRANDPAYRTKITDAIVAAIDQFCGVAIPRAPKASPRSNKK
jgi:N-acetylmuramoyl-L-alanine amidase